MQSYQLETGNHGCDELLYGDSADEVLADVLHHHGIQALPAGWEITPADDGWELAVWQDGGWEDAGNYGSEEDAIAAVKDQAPNAQTADGSAKFGLGKRDCASYETEILVYEDGRAHRFNEGVYVGEC